MGDDKVLLLIIDGVAYSVERLPHRKQAALVKWTAPDWSAEYPDRQGKLVAFFKQDEEADQFQRYMESIASTHIRLRVGGK